MHAYMCYNMDACVSSSRVESSRVESSRVESSRVKSSRVNRVKSSQDASQVPSRRHLKLSLQSIDRLSHAWRPARRQPVQVGAPQAHGVCTEGERLGNVGASCHAAVDNQRHVWPDCLSHLGEGGGEGVGVGVGDW